MGFDLAIDSPDEQQPRRIPAKLGASFDPRRLLINPQEGSTRMTLKKESWLSEMSSRMVSLLTEKERAVLESRFKGVPLEQKADAPRDPAIERIAKELWADGWDDATEEDVIKKIRDLKKENRELHTDMRSITTHVFQRAEESIARCFERYKRDCSSQSIAPLLDGAEAEDAVRTWHLIAHAAGSSEVAKWTVRWCRKKLEALPKAPVGEGPTQTETVLQQLIDDVFDAIDGEGFKS